MSSSGSQCFRVMIKTLVRPFYRKNAGQLVLVFILFFGAVGELEGSKVYTGPLYQLHYQYALILGMLKNPGLFALVLLAWMAYAEKCAQFQLVVLQRGDHLFLNMLNRLPRRRTFSLFYKMQMILFLPITVYSIAILSVAVYKGWYWQALLVAVYIFLICLSPALRAQYQLWHPGKRSFVLLPSWFAPRQQAPSYWTIFVRYIVREQKLLFLGIKLFSCGILFVSLRTVIGSYYDLRMPTVLFGVGILGHGVLIYQLRVMEEKLLLFYRSMPVSLAGRFVQYVLLYAVLFIPEAVTLLLLMPAPLHVRDGAILLVAGYGLLMLLNSLLFSAAFAIRDFLKLVFFIFLLVYLAVLADCLLWLAALSLAGSVVVFFLSYYEYDAAEGQGS